MNISAQAQAVTANLCVHVILWAGVQS